MVIRRNKDGTSWQEPPYTAAELREIEKHCYGTPVAIVRGQKIEASVPPAPPLKPVGDDHD